VIDVAEALRDFFEEASELPGIEMQFGRWVDGGNTLRYGVLRPAGGIAEPTLRQPQFTLSLIGKDQSDLMEMAAAASRCVDAARDDAGDVVVYIQCGEPVFVATRDGRPMFEIAVSVIAS
jgi:hypothetical protein